MDVHENLINLLAQSERHKDHLHLWQKELKASAESLDWLSNLVSTEMRSHDLTFAGKCAHLLSVLRWGSRWYPTSNHSSRSSIPPQPPVTSLTIPKLRHDIEQFTYLQKQGILGKEFTSIIQDYQNVIDRLSSLGLHGRLPLDEETRESIGHVYNRIIHIRSTPRVQRALSSSWDAAAVETLYLDQPPGIVVVDNFLSNEALEGLRLFCIESTVWSANRYAHGRLGAFFHDGFNCPLLLQIAEEVREILPRIIGNKYPLRQLWGFKNEHSLPGNSTIHADFAAVNVNFWITPTEANLDETTGGLVVYRIDAPLDWDFHTYNARSDIIKSFLLQQRAHAISIPYRQNRAIIFNSDLFHGTEEIKFSPDYESRRVNITMLYGERENDIHHRNLSGSPDLISNSGAWRSAAFTRIRKSKL